MQAVAAIAEARHSFDRQFPRRGRADQDVQVKVVIWHADGRLRLDGDAALIERWRTDPAAFLWVDLSPDDGDDETYWLAQFGADETTRNQALSPRFPPKIEYTDAGTFILLRALDAEAQSIEFDTIQMAFLVGERFQIGRA